MRHDGVNTESMRETGVNHGGWLSWTFLGCNETTPVCQPRTCSTPEIYITGIWSTSETLLEQLLGYTGFVKMMNGHQRPDPPLWPGSRVNLNPHEPSRILRSETIRGRV